MTLMTLRDTIAQMTRERDQVTRNLATAMKIFQIQIQKTLRWATDLDGTSLSSLSTMHKSFSFFPVPYFSSRYAQCMSFESTVYILLYGRSQNLVTVCIQLEYNWNGCIHWL
jgi:hypothetical protein